MAYNLASAAASTGVSKSTVLRAIKAGRVSAERDATGQWVIQPADLHRDFLPLPSAATELDALANALVVELRAVITDLRSSQQDVLANVLIAELKAVIDDLRSDRTSKVRPACS